MNGKGRPITCIKGPKMTCNGLPKVHNGKRLEIKCPCNLISLHLIHVAHVPLHQLSPSQIFFMPDSWLPWYNYHWVYAESNLESFNTILKETLRSVNCSEKQKIFHTISFINMFCFNSYNKQGTHLDGSKYAKQGFFVTLRLKNQNR